MKSKLAFCVSVLVLTSACEKPEMSMELAGAVAGAAIGGYVGAQFGGGLGQWASIAGGALVGGGVGYETGRILKESDMVLYRGTAEKALARSSNGTALDWSNPETGNSGVFRPTQTFQALNGQTCRHFRSTVAFSDAVKSGEGTACHGADGNWQIISNYFG
ncbi:MAG: hypothetical protein HQ483_14445 [Rhodospirillales bacterium]|nr:hypothetical protein [Rhodospirillales bacterium]